MTQRSATGGGCRLIFINIRASLAPGLVLKLTYLEPEMLDACALQLPVPGAPVVAPATPRLPGRLLEQDIAGIAYRAMRKRDQLAHDCGARRWHAAHAWVFDETCKRVARHRAGQPDADPLFGAICDALLPLCVPRAQ